MLVKLLSVLALAAPALALNNGLGRTPPVSNVMFASLIKSICLMTSLID